MANTPGADTGPSHSHRWRIDPQGGPTSAGVCECGAIKEFANSWDRDRETSVWSTGRSSRTRGATSQD